MRGTGPHPSNVDGPIHMEAVRWKFDFVLLHSFHQYCGRSLGSLLVLQCARDASILADSHHFVFHVSATLVTNASSSSVFPALQHPLVSPPSHFRILRTISIFFSLCGDYDRMLSASLLIPEKRVWASMFLFNFAIWSGELALFEQHGSV